MAMPGRAQQAPQGRYAFADTTLLRDTLGLRFDGLFPIADSLGLRPDSLRAQSIRYRYTLPRLLKLSDSLGVPVDSVGVVMRRERFNPLAATAQRHSNDFAYNSTYSIGQSTTLWTNSADYNLVQGSIFLGNNTVVTTDRYRAGGFTTEKLTRFSRTEAGWRFSPNFSMGGRVELNRYESRALGAFGNEDETRGDYQVSVRSRQQPARGLTSELNFNSGVVDLANTTQEKRGVSGDVNGRLRYARGWITHDFSGQVNGNAARSQVPGNASQFNTQDLSTNLRGTLGVLSNGPLGLNLNYNLRESRIESPTTLKGSNGDSIVIQQIQTGGRGVDLSLRLRRDNDRYLNVGSKIGNSRSASATQASSQNSRDDQGLTIAGRYGFRSWSLDGSFGRTLTTSKYPRRGGANEGGYGEDLDSRSLDGTLAWNPSQRVTLKATGGVSLTRSRYFIIGSYLNPPVPRDQYRQSYRVDGNYTHSQRFNTGVGLEVSRYLFVNIPAASTAANTETRSYRAEWRWTFRLLPGLTATQRNQASADYAYYTFLPSTSDRLSLDYFTSTQLNAAITPRLQLDITHDHRYQPTGGYAPLDPPLDDGNSYFSQVDENVTSRLLASISYTPTPALSITIRPDFTSSERQSINEGVAVPQRESRNLTFSGGANLNLPVGRRGQLTGSLSRTFRSDRTTNYVSGVPDLRPVSEIDYWVGNLEFSWSL
jgi:hypothetical protein